MDYEKLKNFCCCDLDVNICSAMEEYGSQRKAAKALKIGQSTLCERLGRLRQYAATKGYAPEQGLEDLPVPNQLLQGVSTLYGESGEVKARWVKTKADSQAAMDVARAVVEEMLASIKPEEPVKGPKISESDLLNLYVLTDAHLGMYAHHEEGGSNWDIKIAERTIISAFEYLIHTTPQSKVGFFLNLGDLLHSDSILPVTPTSQHVLDQDTRQHRVIRTGIRIVRSAMQMLLSRHEMVILLNAQGNHDMVSALWMQAAFEALYEEEERVEVVVSPLPYYAYKHGKNLLAFTHGHKKRGRVLADLISGQFRHLLAETEHTFIHTGHLHSQELVETPTSTIEQHPTLAARDSYAAQGGWLSKRGMQAIVYHKDRLEIGRSTYRPERNV